MDTKILWLSAFALLLISCFGKDAEQGSTLTGARIQVIGHGGSGFDSIDNFFPANARKSILHGVDILGADGVEVDVQMTKDSVLVLYHDDLLETQTNCAGRIADAFWSEIKDCRFRSNIVFNYDVKETLWTLESLLADFAAREDSPWINLDVGVPLDFDSDLEAGKYFRTLARQLSSLLGQYQAKKWVYVELALLEELQHLQSLDVDLNLVWLVGSIDTDLLALTASENFWGIVVKNKDIDKGLVEEAHRLGLGVILYNVKIRQGTLDAVAKGPDLIETDNIPLLHSVLE